MRRATAAVLAAMLCAALAPAASAQEGPAAAMAAAPGAAGPPAEAAAKPSAPTAPLRIMPRLSAAGFDAEEEADLRDSLESALTASSLVSAALRADAGDDDLAAAAALADCPVALDVELSKGELSIRADWSYLYSFARGLTLSSGSFEKAMPKRRDLATSFWIETVRDLEAAAAALPLGRVVVAAPPGARIGGFGESLLVPASGELELSMRLPAVVAWKARAPGYLDASGSAFVDAASSRVEIGMLPAPRWTAELALYGLSFPELRASLLLGRRLFARASLSEFLAGLGLQNYDGPPPGRSIIASYPLLQAGLGIGYFLGDPDRLFRGYAALDGFLRLDLPDGEFFVDPVAPAALNPLVGAEWGLERGAKLFLEFGCAFYPYADPAFMAASRGEDGGNLAFGGAWPAGDWPGWFFELPIAKLGARLYLR